jgi:hypothetical protein
MSIDLFTHVCIELEFSSTGLVIVTVGLRRLATECTPPFHYVIAGIWVPGNEPEGFIFESV